MPGGCCVADTVPCDTSVFVFGSLTPSLPQPVKFPGCKVHTHTPANSIFDGPITNLTFNAVHFDKVRLSCAHS